MNSNLTPACSLSCQASHRGPRWASFLAATSVGLLLLACALAAHGDTLFVNLNNPTPAAPYTNWDTAATDIQTAVDAATAGGLLVVSNGVYQSGVRVVDGMGTLTNPPQLWLDLTDPMPPARFYRVWQAETPNVLPAADLALATELTLTVTPGTNLRVDWINRYGPIDAWVTLATVPLTAASQTYVDLTMFGQPPRLYRLVPVP